MKPFDCSSMSLANVVLTSSMSPPSKGDVGRCRTGDRSFCSPLIWSRAVAVCDGAAVAGFSMLWKDRIMSMTTVKESSSSFSADARDSARTLSKSLGGGGQA